MKGLYVMKVKFKKIISVLLCVVVFVMMGSVNFAYAAETNTNEEFCEIKRTTATVLINRFEKIDFYAEYYVSDDKNVEFIWTIEGDGNFINGETKKITKGETAQMRFIDDTTVKLQIVSSNGEVIAEDEVFLERYGKNDGTFIQSFFMSIYLGIVSILNVIVEAFSIFA